MFGIFAQAEANWFLPQQASTIAPEIDWLQWFVLWVCIIFGTLVFALTFLIGWRYRHRKGVNDSGHGPTHSTLLEVTWTVIPAIIVLLIAIWGFQGFMKANVMPQRALEIQVEGYKWGWNFIYPNGYQDNQLHIPKGVPVRLVLSSRDVLHSLYFPQFRTKKDVVPGRYNKMWVEATVESPLPAGFNREKNASYIISNPDDPKEVDLKSGKDFGFDIYCTEYCGTNHSMMLTKVHVHPTVESYEAWLADAGNVLENYDPVNAGRILARQNGCLGCHSINDQDPSQPRTGPSWVNLFGKQGQFTDGSTYVADENYIKESIHYPQKHIVAGYGAGMPPYMNISDRQIEAITRFMKSISTHYQGNIDDLKKPFPKEGENPEQPQASAK